MTPVWHIWRLHAAVKAKICGTRRTNARFLNVKRRILQKQKPTERLPLGRFPFDRLPLRRTVTTEAADVLTRVVLLLSLVPPGGEEREVPHCTSREQRLQI